MEEAESKGTIETIIEELELDTTIHDELMEEVMKVYEMFKGRTDAETARYLTIAYMVRRMSARKLPLNKEERSKYKPPKIEKLEEAEG